MCEQENNLPEYEVPEIITYTDDDILIELGPALTIKLDY
jgi:hypothetical protein